MTSSGGFEPYREVALRVETELAPHEVPVGDMAKIVRQIVEGEGPVHQDEVGRRVAFAFGKDRSGQRIAAAVIRALQSAGDGLAEKDGFWDVAGRDVRVRTRAGAAASLRRAEMLPDAEIAAAIAVLVRDNGAFARSELVIAAARSLGFDRAGADLKARLSGAVDILAARGDLKFDGVRYSGS